jgi:RNA polymerase sigma-70 factor (ECF subfamily)
VIPHVRGASERAMTAGADIPGDDVVRRAQRGDVDAFEVLYHAYAPGIRLLCRRMAHDERDARDLVQDIFVRAWEKLELFRGESAFATWLHRLAVNVVLGHLKSARRDALRFIDSDDDQWPPAAGRSFEHQLDARMDIESAVAQLPDGARTVFVLHDLEGHSHDEIAQQLGLAAGTVRAHLWRARRRLMRLLDA